MTAAPAVRERRGRTIGAFVGLTAGALFAAVATTLVASLAPAASADLLSAVATPTVLTGTVVGWLFGRRGWRASRWFDRGVTSLGMALVATAIGAYLVGVQLMVAADVGWDSPGVAVVEILFGAAVAWLYGVIIFGLLAVPVTFAAGLLWAWIMGRLARASA